MRFLDQSHLREAIDAQGGSDFDSLAVERYLFRNHQQLFVRELHANVEAPYPVIERVAPRCAVRSGSNCCA